MLATLKMEHSYCSKGNKDFGQGRAITWGWVLARYREDRNYPIITGMKLITVLILSGQGRNLQQLSVRRFGVQLEAVVQFCNRTRYTGQQYDDLTGQCYLRARDGRGGPYHPQIL